MSNAYNMSPAELRELADNIEKAGKPIKKAKLKHDLYEFVNPDRYQSKDDDFCFDIDEASVGFGLEKFFLTKEETEKIQNEFKKCFKILCEKGAEFYCHKEIDGTKTWVDYKDAIRAHSDFEDFEEENLIEVERLD